MQSAYIPLKWCGYGPPIGWDGRWTRWGRSVGPVARCDALRSLPDNFSAMALHYNRAGCHCRKTVKNYIAQLSDYSGILAEPRLPTSGHLLPCGILVLRSHEGPSVGSPLGIPEIFGPEQLLSFGLSLKNRVPFFRKGLAAGHILQAMASATGQV